MASETPFAQSAYEVTDAKDRARLQNLFRSQNGYYQKLLQYAIKAQKS